MKFYLYSSKSVFRQDDYSDIEILRGALTNNAIFGITGFLHRTKTHFIQYFEGRDDLAERLWNNVSADRRHYDIRLLSTGEVLFPKFSGWSMGYSDSARHGDGAEIDPAFPPELIIKELEKESERQLIKFVKPVVKENAMTG